VTILFMLMRQSFEAGQYRFRGDAWQYDRLLISKSFMSFVPVVVIRLYFVGSALRKARRWGITDIEISVEDLIERSDSRLFSKVQSDSHCLNQLLPPPSPASQIYDLRPRGHTHSLPSVKTTNFMKSFIIKSLFSYK